MQAGMLGQLAALCRYNPTDVGRAAKLLQGGGVVGKGMQPYEAHIPFLLQLKIDLNLAGMGWLHLSQVIIRQRHFGKYTIGVMSTLLNTLAADITCILVATKLWPPSGMRILGEQIPQQQLCCADQLQGAFPRALHAPQTGLEGHTSPHPVRA